MSWSEKLGDKVKKTIENHPAVRNAVEGAVTVTKNAISQEMDPEKNPELELLLMVGGTVVVGLIFMTCMGGSPVHAIEAAAPLYKDITINYYYGS